nr:DUF1343 domain-containing protein [Aestuariivivens sediminis]
MTINMFKNTVLLFVLVMISCGSKMKKKNIEFTQEKHNPTESPIIVGANQTESYLPLLKSKRVGIVANPTSVIFTQEPTPGSKTYVHIVDSLLALNINIIKVFSPEHGFRGTADAGEVVKDGVDVKTNIPIVSLYGNNKKPSPEQLEGLDIVIFDIQDVGVRFYTYISTMHYIMEACAEANIPVLILDRPNPNGHYIDGPTLDPKNKSFLGMHPIPLVHGMTIGEYAQMINGEKWLKNEIQCRITIIPVKNYNHQTPYSLPVRPSPNLPNDQAIKLYPSLGLFEGTNINAGRGTAYQFQCYGAPFLNKETFTFNYTPTENFGAKNPKHKNELCYGEDLRNEKISGKMSLKWIMKSYWNANDKSLVFNTANFTKHAGTDKLQQQIEAGLAEEDIRATWREDIEAFTKVRKQYLLYP